MGSGQRHDSCRRRSRRCRLRRLQKCLINNNPKPRKRGLQALALRVNIRSCCPRWPKQFLTRTTALPGTIRPSPSRKGLPRQIGTALGAAIYRSADATLYATDGICTHGNTHFANGFVKGTLIECPKHNGRFDIDPAALEYYLCGPPLMVKATTTMLHDIGVADSQISYDEF
jgi:hypothetical protein